MKLLILRKSKIPISCLYKHLLIRNDSLHFKPYDAAELTKDRSEGNSLLSIECLKEFKGRGS